MSESAEGRREQRVVVNEPALMIGPGRNFSAVRLLDVSRLGLRLSTPVAHETGAEVKIQLGGTVIQGIVRWSANKGAGQYHVGVEISGVVASKSNEWEKLLSRAATSDLVW